MSDVFYNYFPEYSGTAADYAGTVGGFNIGPQPYFSDFITTPAATTGSFDTSGYYTPTFDFASYLPTSSYAGAAPTFSTPADFPTGTEASYSFVSPTAQGGFYTPPSAETTAAAPAARTVGGLDVSAGTAIDAPGADRKTAGVLSPDQGGLQGLLGKLDLTKLLTGGLGGIMSYMAAQRAQEDAARARAEYEAAAKKAAGDVRGLAQPYLTAGGSQLAMALQGALSPAQQQMYQAQQAQLAQAAARTGGVGAIQTAAAEQTMYQKALENQQNMALQLLGPGNQMAYNAIMTELQGSHGGLQLEMQYGMQAAQAMAGMMQSLGYGAGSVGTQQRTA